MDIETLFSHRGTLMIIAAAVLIPAAVVWSLVRARRHQQFLFANDEAFARLTKAQQKNVTRLYTGLVAFEKAYLASRQDVIEMNLKYVFDKYHTEVAGEEYGAYRAISYEYHGLIELYGNHLHEASEWFARAQAVRSDKELFTESARKHMLNAERHRHA